MVTDVPNGRNVDILLVEDNPSDVQRIEHMLAMLEDAYRLHIASSVKSAHQTLSDQPVQIILLDLTLPDSDGLQTIRTMHATYPWVPIVVLTGLDNDQLVDEAATAGAHDYLVKHDLNPVDLWRVLRYALERRLHEEQLRTSQRAYRRQAGELHLLNRIISAASASKDEQSILDVTCLELAQFYSALRVLILMRHHQDSFVTLQAEHHQPDMPPVRHSQINQEVEDHFSSVYLIQQPLVCPHLPTNLRLFLNSPENSKAIIHPLILEKENIGFILLNLPHSHELAVSDVHLLAMVAEEIALALTKIRLHGRLQAYANELEDRVQERTQALAEANEQLKSLDKLKSKFVSDVSHELRNPITNLTLYLELLEFAKPEKRPKYFTILRNQIRRLANLVEEILTLSRLENESHQNLFQPVDFNYLIQQVVVAHKPRAQNKQIKLQFTPTTPLPPAWGEPNQITQIVTNLLDNALNYTTEGTITVATDRQEDESGTEIILTISDSGTGIQEGDLPYIFDRFYRGSQINRDEIMGTGLGLGIVNEIVALHNGRINVSSKPNQGSTFTVILPAATQE